MREQPAGWYRDPVRPNRHRYWSGEQWSKTVGEELQGLKTRTAYEADKETDSQYGERRACG